jgi:phosphatidate cytidylyltransferase
MDFKKIAAALILLPAFVLLVVWGEVWMILALVLTLVVGLGSHEYARIAFGENARIETAAVALFSAIVCVLTGKLFAPIWILAALAGSFLLTAIFFMLLEKSMDKVLLKTAKVFHGVILFGWFAGMIVALKSFEVTVPAAGGFKLLLALFALTWVNDSGAYFAGTLLGKHKLAPTLSPNKTIEGSLGGFLGTIAMAVVIAMMSDFLPIKDALVLGVILGIIGPLGDLYESALKRGSGIKDSGKFMPGHGGVFDRVDSVLFCAPVLYFYVYFTHLV